MNFFKSLNFNFPTIKERYFAKSYIIPDYYTQERGKKMFSVIRKKKYAAALLFLAIPAAVLSSAVSQSTFRNLSGLINSDGDDYSPSMTASGRIVVFNSKKSGEKSHNIYMCRNNSGLWSKPIPLAEINSKYNDETPFISRDGSTLIFSSDRPGGNLPSVTSDGRMRITYDLYVSRNIKGKWTKPELITGDVNTSMNERSPALSGDGHILFFTRWPYRKFSRAKIYMAKLDNGSYTGAVELPESINSGNYEVALIPSMKRDRYYFSSMRKGGMGGWDIYYTSFINGKFSNPVNAGKNVNSPYDDICYNETNQYALISSTRPGGYGKFDLYSTLKVKDTDKIVRKNYRNYNRETRLRITAADRKTGILLGDHPFKITLHESGRGFNKERTTLRKSNNRGFFVIRPKNNVGWITISSENNGYRESSIKVRVVTGNYQDIIIFLSAAPAVKDQPPVKTEKKSVKEKAEPERISRTAHRVKPDSIYFDFNSVKIKTKYYPSLQKVINLLRENQNLELIISGHCDSTGTRRINYIISRKRAMAVLSYLKGMGIAESRMSVRAMGEKFARSEKKRTGFSRLNRRVEFTVKEK